MDLQGLFTTGINAARDVFVAREANDPTPNSRGNNDVTAQAGAPAGSFAAALGGNTGTILAVVAVGVLVYLLARR